MGQSAVVFVRIGWMATYQGSRTKDRPVGGGEYNENNIGLEKDNFLPDACGRVHGYSQTRKNLFRIDGCSETKKLDKISSVLVIFVATHPTEGGGRIVGWYKNAICYRDDQPLSNGNVFRMEADAKDAILVPVNERSFRIPKATKKLPAMGQKNVFYLYDKNGNLRDLPWVGKALDYVCGYMRSNVLNPDEIDIADSSTVFEIQQERRAGRSSNPKLRKAVEEHAMEIVKQHYQKKGIDLEDKSKTCSYDFSYTVQGKQRFIEVKGSQLKNPAIILTRNEVEFARENQRQMELCVVHSINVDGKDDPKASGGILECFPQWNPDNHELSAMQYECCLNRDLVDSKWLQ